MASNRAEKSGFAKEAQAKVVSKFDGAEAAKALRWIRALQPTCALSAEMSEQVNAIPKDIQDVSWADFHKYLNNGLVLGYLITCLDANAFNASSKKAWEVSKMQAFETSRQRERIGIFLSWVSQYGVATTCSFQTDQLYEETDLSQVVTCLSQLGVEAQSKPGYTGPSGYWMAKHQQNKRDFTEEQLNESKKIISTQMGYTGGANASGVSFGGQRHINDMH